VKPNISLTSTVQFNKEVPAYDMPPLLDHTKEAKSQGQVCIIKGFLQYFVKLLNDPSYVKVLKNMLEKLKEI
jgi:hypothetical protein